MGDRLAAVAAILMAGTRQMNAGPILEYFAPLHAWLDDQIAGQPSGW